MEATGERRHASRPWRDRWTAARLRHAASVACWRVAWALTGLMLAFAGARILAHDRTWLLVLANAYTAWIHLPAWVVAPAAGVTRRWPLMAATLLVVVLQTTWMLPDYAGRDPLPAAAAEAPHLTVMTANLRERNDDVSGIIREAMASGAEVIFLQEYTPEAEQTVEELGLLAAYPYRIRDIRQSARGTAIFSQYPLEDAETWDVAGVPMTRATAVLPDGRQVRLYNVHPVSPTTARDTHRWDDEHEALLAALAQEHGDVVVAGDFNMTRQHRWYGKYEDLGLREQHMACGQGRATTWPNGMRHFPPIRLDHVFASKGFACITVTEGKGEGSDHRPVVAVLALLPD